MSSSEKARIELDSVFTHAPGQVSSNLDGETVMMSVENGKYYGLDDIGSRIWELIEQPIKVSDLINTLLKRFDVDREACERDVLIFINELNEDRILQVRE